jgi:hypothetical protein
MGSQGSITKLCHVMMFAPEHGMLGIDFNFIPDNVDALRTRLMQVMDDIFEVMYLDRMRRLVIFFSPDSVTGAVLRDTVVREIGVMLDADEVQTADEIDRAWIEEPDALGSRTFKSHSVAHLDRLEIQFNFLPTEDEIAELRAELLNNKYVTRVVYRDFRWCRRELIVHYKVEFTQPLVTINDVEQGILTRIWLTLKRQSSGEDTSVST